MFVINEVVEKETILSGLSYENAIDKLKVEEFFFSSGTVSIEKSSRNKYNSLLTLFKVFLGTVTVNVNEEVEIHTIDILSRFFIDTMDTDMSNEVIISNYSESLIEEYFISEKGESLLEYEYKSNIDFYDSLLNEILHFYYYQNKEAYLSAYIHLYRVYEYISYTFPLIFVNNSKNYSQSYKELQSFFSDKGEELAFFRVFMQKTFLLNDYIYSELYSESYELSLSENDFDFLNREMKKFINDFNSSRKKKNNTFLKSVMGTSDFQEKEKFTFLDEAEKKFVISTLDVNDLLISLRNKACHYKVNHSDSIRLSEYFFDDLFRILNPVFLNWIANIFKYVVYSSTQKYRIVLTN